MTGYGGPGGLPRRKQGRGRGFEDSGSWSGFFHPDKAPVTERIPRVREPEFREPGFREPEFREPGFRQLDSRQPEARPPQPRQPRDWPPPGREPRFGEEFPAPPTERWRQFAPPPPPAAGPPKRGGRRLALAASVLGVLVVVLAGAATFVLLKGGGSDNRKATGQVSASATPAASPSVVPHLAAKGKAVAPAGAPYRYGIPAGFVIGSCSVTQGNGAPKNPTCVQPTGATTQDMVLVMNFPITVDADKLPATDIEHQLDTLYADRLHSTYQYLSVDGTRAWRTQLDGAGTTSIEVHLFKGRQHVQVLCQWTPAHQKQITTGCDAVLSTLTVT